MIHFVQNNIKIRRIINFLYFIRNQGCIDQVNSSQIQQFLILMQSYYPICYPFSLNFTVPFKLTFPFELQTQTFTL